MPASRLSTLGLAAAALLAAAGCRRGPEKITLGEVKLAAFGLVYIAHVEGYFAAEGVDVAVREYTSGRDAVTGMLDGEVDAAISYETPAVVRAFDTPDLRVITMLHRSVEDTRVFARRDRGIASPEDLRGKRIGVPRDTSAEVFLDTLLASSGIRPDEIRRLDLRPVETGIALSSGEVDAIAIWFPHPPDLSIAPAALVEIRSTSYPELSVLVSRAPTIDAKREGLLRMLRALSRAERLVHEQPAAAMDAVVREMAPWPATLVREGWARTDAQLGLTNLLLASFERQAEWQRTRGRPGPLPNFDALIDERMLLEVDPESVTLLGGE